MPFYARRFWAMCKFTVSLQITEFYKSCLIIFKNKHKVKVKDKTKIVIKIELQCEDKTKT